MNDTTFGTQTSVYFRKIFRIAIREKAWKYLIFATIIASIVVFIVGDGMFSDFGYDSTKSGFFTLASACIWIGIFNSIQSICKEHEIIRAEYRQGMKMSSYIAAHVIWQALLCLAESILVFILCCIKMNFNKSPSLIISAYSENFVTIYLLTFGAAVLGLMISSISGNPTTAMTIMPFVLIVQLILCGALFDLSGVRDFFSNFTLRKWGMAAFSCESDLNNMELAINGRLMAEGHLNGAPLKIDSQHANWFYVHEAGRLLLSWLFCILLTAFNAVISVAALKLKNRDS